VTRQRRTAVEIVAPTLPNATFAEADVAGFAVEPNAVVPAPKPLFSNVFQTLINLVRASLYDAPRKIPKNRNALLTPFNLPIRQSLRHFNPAPLFNLFKRNVFAPSVVRRDNFASLFQPYKRRRFSADARRFNERAIHPFDFQTFQTSLFFRVQRRFQTP